MQAMTHDERLAFLGDMSKLRRNAKSAFWLAMLLGVVGAHHFYLGNKRRGFAYLLGFWTGIPAVVSVWEALKIRDIVRKANFRIATRAAMRARIFGG